MPLRFILTVALLFVLTYSKTDQYELKYPIGWSKDGIPPPEYFENEKRDAVKSKLYFRNQQQSDNLQNLDNSNLTEKPLPNDFKKILVPVFFTFKLPTSTKDIPPQLKVSFMYHLPDDIPDDKFSFRKRKQEKRKA
ncbi:uncharacterized protein LOC129228526 [Uloborus diversus]|uniref:uncharacterized protein LOC129228526 n=1 Tax=Uloborus diversus TaxID=327109 RepID=UPI00240A20A9|nr:uncharacterized protein LOC129228526 [Uloborus diversus]